MVDFQNMKNISGKMKKLKSGIIPALFIMCSSAFAQTHVSVTVTASAKSHPISPYIFGRNNNLSDNAASPLSAARWQFFKDLGLNFFRENGGNNATKYNWKRKLSSHPDWYNNVYAHDWDYAAKSLQANLPGAQGLWAFQLIGKAASNTGHNFNDWAYNQSKWWSGVGQNLAGGGTPDPAGGSKALIEGNPDLYLENWTADSTTAILDHWFGPSGLGLDSTHIRYWSMDNEPEIWNGTHDDVYPIQPDAETFMQKYFAVAKLARAKFPGIKLMGPVPANEWQWYNYNGGKISYKGKSYVWLEYFIMRCAEEEQATGIRLLDVLDIHFYPEATAASDLVQLYRVFFDTTYVYPNANGVKNSGPGGWDNSLNKEYIFKRCNDWLVKYMGPNHGVTLSVSETGFTQVNPTVTAVTYGSILGEFARQGVEVFTPWSWNTGMYEALHLFSRYHKPDYVDGVSSDNLNVSAYPTISAGKDSLVIFLVNRNLTESRQADLNLVDFPVKDGSYTVYTLSNLPSSETFVSHTSNALVKSTLQVTGNKPSLILPPLSITAIVLNRENFITTSYGYPVAMAEAEGGILSGVTKASTYPGYSGTGYVTGFDNAGDSVTVSMNVPSDGLYKLVIRYIGKSGDKDQKLSVNGEPAGSVHFPGSDTFTYVEAGSYLLKKGANTFAIIKDWGWTDIDRFDLYPAMANVFDITPSLIDTQALDTTRALYRFIFNQFGSRILSGQTEDYFTQLKTVAGYTPMIRNGDLMNYTPGYPYKWENNTHVFGIVDNGEVENMISWYQSTGGKGIVAYQWHWCSPTGGSAGTNTFYTQYTTFDITRAVTPGTLEDSLILRDIDDIAIQLKKFQDAGIPVLWRPLHEAGGGWFWWGAKGSAACKKLYDIMYDRLTNYHHLHNLIWVWSTPETDWYPGNDKVDIIGYDSYPGAYVYGNQKAAFDVLYKLTGGKKLIAMSENGPIPDPESCLQGDAPWAYFMSWSNLVTQQNSNAHIQAVFADENVLKLESTNARTSREWRSTLYPENWVPGFSDSEGRFLHDFSYAGYHAGMTGLPTVKKNMVDITKAPYNADNTGTSDATSAIQQALDDVGQAGGGVVYLPAGTYRIGETGGTSSVLQMSYDSTVLRGAGADSTFLFNTQTHMRDMDIIQVKGNLYNWFDETATRTNISIDLLNPTRILPVTSVSGFHAGDLVIVTSTPTDAFIAEHNMTGKWNARDFEGVAFLRTIDSVDAGNNLLIIDAPTRYYLKTRDQARVYLAHPHLSECGIENLSLGNAENLDTGWGDNDYLLPGTGAYEVHASHAIHMRCVQNGWIRNVNSFRPSGNSDTVQLLSNGILLEQCRYITVDSCFFQKPQYKGDGGNGYMYILESNDCLVEYSHANQGRHNFDFKYPFSNGNVILRCLSENPRYASDFHMYLSMANLFDNCTLNGDFLESVYRPYGSTSVHGYTSTQSVFYNTVGMAYHPGKNFMVDSRQFGNGYIIGTSGPACLVNIYPVEGMANAYFYDTSPVDFTEGIGTGKDLVPASLYLDQLAKRKKNPYSYQQYHVRLVVKDKQSGLPVPACMLVIYRDTVFTDNSGQADFAGLPGVFVLSASQRAYNPVSSQEMAINSDTTLTIFLTPRVFRLNVKVVNNVRMTVLSGVSISIGGTMVTTNTSGQASASVSAGQLAFTASKANYLTLTGTLLINTDTSVTLVLTQSLATAKIWLTDGSAPLNNAVVKVENDSLVTGALGLATFSQLPVPATYHYTISRSGYAGREGDFDLVTDTSIYLSMDKALGIQDEPQSSTRMWPNPAHDVLNCSFQGNSQETVVIISDLAGKEIFKQSTHKNILQIKLAGYPSGTYVVRIQSGNLNSTEKFVRE